MKSWQKDSGRFSGYLTMNGFDPPCWKMIGLACLIHRMPTRTHKTCKTQTNTPPIPLLFCKSRSIGAFWLSFHLDTLAPWHCTVIVRERQRDGRSVVSYSKRLPDWTEGGMKRGRGESGVFWCWIKKVVFRSQNKSLQRRSSLFLNISLFSDFFDSSLKIKNPFPSTSLFLFPRLSLFICLPNQLPAYPPRIKPPRLSIYFCPPFFFHLSSNISFLSRMPPLLSSSIWPSVLACQLSHVELCLLYLLPINSLHSGLLQYGPRSPPCSWKWLHVIVDGCYYVN